MDLRDGAGASATVSPRAAVKASALLNRCRCRCRTRTVRAALLIPRSPVSAGRDLAISFGLGISAYHSIARRLSKVSRILERSRLLDHILASHLLVNPANHPTVATIREPGPPPTMNDDPATGKNQSSSDHSAVRATLTIRADSHIGHAAGRPIQ